MKKPNFLVILPICAICSGSMLGQLYAFDDQRTHPDISNRAVSQAAMAEHLQRRLAFDNKEKSYLRDYSSNQRYTIQEWLGRGSTAEDSPACRASNHFHDPLLPWTESHVSDSSIPSTCSLGGWSPRYSNVTWATGYFDRSPDGQKETFTLPADKAPNTWDKAREYFHAALTSETSADREAYFAQTFQAVGQTMHLLQDMAAINDLSMKAY